MGVYTKQPQTICTPNRNGVFGALWGGSLLVALPSLRMANIATGNSYVSRSRSGVVGTAPNEAFIGGLAQKTAGGGKHGSNYSAPNIALTSFTIAAVVRFTSVTGTQVITGNDDGNSGGMRMVCLNGDFVLAHIGINNIILSTGALSANNTYFLAVSRNNAANSEEWVVANITTGKILSGTKADSTGWNTPTTGLWPVGYGRTTVESVAGYVFMAYISSSIVSNGFLVEWAKNPWALFSSPERAILFVQASGGTTTNRQYSFVAG